MQANPANPNPIFNVKIVPDPLFKRIVRHPFRTYGRVGSFVFGAVGVINFGTTILGFGDGKGMSLLRECPQAYFAGLLWKMSYYGILWPAFCIDAVTDTKSAFIYGAGLKKIFNN